MPRPPVNLAEHINQTHDHRHAANFPTALAPLLIQQPDGTYAPFPERQAIVRTDTGKPLAAVSNRYTLVTHAQILDPIEEALKQLNHADAPRGIFVDRSGARMRALYKFPNLAEALTPNDSLCPLIRLTNSYDGTSRVLAQIGAFRFVCTNLAVGGGGFFASGFMSHHRGQIDITKVAQILSDFLTRFQQIMQLYRFWRDQPFNLDETGNRLPDIGKRLNPILTSRLLHSPTVFDAYNTFTDLLTHNLRSPARSFALLEQTNRAFQQLYPYPQQ